MKAESHKLLAGSGWYRHTGTGTLSTIRHFGIVPVANTIINSWSIVDAGGVTHDLLAWFNLTSDVTQISTSDPALIIPDAWLNGTNPASLKLTSGTVDVLRHGL